MKKILWVFCLVMAFVACNSQKQEPDAASETASAEDATESDTLDVEKAEEALPARADELFDDFIFNFSMDSAVQKVRTFFPLPLVKDGEKTTIKKKDWKYDPLFANRDFYTILYNSEEEMEMEKDTSLTQVRVEYLNLDTKKAKRYQFKRYQGIGVWCLYGITTENMDGEKDATDFWTFYHTFAGDSIYQREHIHNPLKFVTIDPDDDFNVIETTLDVDQWFAFRPELPKQQVTNVNYGQSYGTKPQEKTLCLRGCGNGFNNILTFRKEDGQWMLTGFEDTSE